MTLIEKIKDAKDRAASIRAASPDITNLWFEFKDIPVAEIEARAKEIDREFDIVNRDKKDVLRLQVHEWIEHNLTIFAYSVPVKVTRPEFLSEA